MDKEEAAAAAAAVSAAVISADGETMTKKYRSG